MQFLLILLLPLWLLPATTSGDDSSSMRKEPSQTVTPMANPWDANAWEARSGESFWKAKAKKSGSQAGPSEKPLSLAKKTPEKQIPGKQAK